MVGGTLSDKALIDNAPKAIRRGMKVAYEMAMQSTSPCHKVGAAVYKGSRLISSGVNSRKTHPDSRTISNGQHAEFASLVNLHKHREGPTSTWNGNTLHGTTVFVIRLTRGLRVGISRPCDACYALLCAMGVKKVVFIDREGKIATVRL